MLGRHFELTVHHATSAAEMREAAAREARSGCPLLIAGGGDGTVNLLVNAIAGTGAALGILPLGTANDLARQLGIPRDPAAAARRLIEGVAAPCDVMVVNGRRFVTVGGVGLVTECALDADRLKAAGHPLRPLARSLGAAIYPAVAMPRILLGGRCTWEMNLSWTGPGDPRPVTIRSRAHAVFFANQRGIGGDLTLPVDARNDDGVAEICVMEAGSRLRLVRTILAMRMARRIDRRVIGVHRAWRAEIESATDLGFLGDGELLASGRHFAVEVVAGGLTVVR